MPFARKFLLFLIHASAALGTGCQHSSGIEPHPNHWVGKPASELIAARGAPDDTVKSSDGNSVLIWKKPWMIGGHDHECRKSFIVGPDNKITKWTYEDC